ncbi:MAG: hypothetical protein H0T46_34940 [Deltaproteobacteria bacterium]|nr:hypothetical protein [Deltaproteobacteria bacterium]
MRRLAFVAFLVTAPACSVFWEKGSGGGDDVCVFGENDEPAIAQAPLRDPSNLTCVSFGGGGCNPECGPCPAITAHRTPVPSWGVCGSGCDALGDGACTMTPDCRTTRDATCTIGPNACITDFLGCFPTDFSRDDTINCFTADASTCSRSKKCEAHHGHAPCPVGGGECPRPFVTCVPVGVSPGSCDGQVTCRRVAPTCPAGTTPGIANGCYTDACIVTTQCPKPA